MEEGLRELLSEFPDLELNEKTKRIRCKLSGHEMPCSVKEVSSYVYGKKYKGLKTKLGLNVESLSPLIVPSVLKKQKLFCCLTGKHINNTRSQVDTHVSGSKYQSAKNQFDAGLRELIKEVKEKPPSKREDKKKRKEKKEEERERGEDSDMEIVPQEEKNTTTTIKPVKTKPSAVVKHKLPPKKGVKKKQPPTTVVNSEDKSDVPMEEGMVMNEKEEKDTGVKSSSVLRKRKTDHKVMSRRKRLLLEKAMKSRLF